MNSIDQQLKNDVGWVSGLAEQTEECKWCGKLIHEYVKCYYGSRRVGLGVICAKCGDEAKAIENESIYE